MHAVMKDHFQQNNICFALLNTCADENIRRGVILVLGFNRSKSGKTKESKVGIRNFINTLTILNQPKP